MASSATTAISSHPSVTTPGAKTANTDVSGGDSFADMLASVDAATLMQGQAPATAATAEAPLPQDAEAGTDIETADIPAALLPQAGAKPQGPQPSVKDANDIGKDETKAKDDGAAQPPANDNMNAQPMLPIPATPVQAAAPQDDKTAPAAIQAASQAPAQAPQQAANDSEAEDDAAPQAVDAGQAASSKPAAGKPAKSDFKKALDNARSTPNSDTAPAQAADSGKDAKLADAKLDARAAETPAQQAAHTNNPQPDAIAPATATANTAHTGSTATPAAAREAAAPAPHHAPNLESLAVNIAAKSQGGAKQFDIRLDPPELGRVEVRLSIDATGKAEAHLSADQQQTLDLLQKDAPALTRALREAGLDVSQDGLNFSLRNQQQQAGQEQGHGHGGRAWRGNVQTQVPLETANAAGAYAPRGLGLLDIKV